MTVKTLADLSGAPYNPRTISEKSLGGLTYSMAEFGDLSGIVFNERTGCLVAGHQRTKGLRRQYGDLQIVDGQITTPEGHVFPVRVVDWPIEKEKAANVAANATTIQGSFTADLSALVAEIEVDMPEAFSALDLDTMICELDEGDAEPVAAAEEDEPPEVVEDGEPDSVRGEVYELGPHRLMCGDCREADDWRTLLDGAKANLVFTSPPYASQRKYDESSGFKPIPPDEYGDWWAPLQEAVRGNLADDGSFFVNIKEHCQDGQRHLYVKKLTIHMVEEWGWRFVDELCWERNTVPGAFPNRLKNGWEPVLHFSLEKRIKFEPKAVAHESKYAIDYNPDVHFGNTPRGYEESDGRAKSAAQYDGLALPSNVLQCSQDHAFGKEGSGHAAPFPMALPSFFVRAFSDEGDIVLDPFMGSGTTMIAAAEHGRQGYGFEISPRYCDVIRRRWTRWATKHDVDPGHGALE